MEIPLFLFLGMISTALALAFFGFLRQPQIPAMLAFGGMFVLFISVSTTSIILDDNITTSIERVISPSNWILAQDNTVGVFNGINSFAQATDNTVYDQTTNDFWTLGTINVQSNPANSVIERKHAGGSVPGYSIQINASQQLVGFINDGSAGPILVTVTTHQIIVSNIYVWGASFDRDSNLTLFLYNINTGTLYTGSGSISSQQGSISNTQFYTLGKHSSTSTLFCECHFDNTIPPTSGLLTQSQFINYATTGDLSGLPSFNNIYRFEDNLDDGIGINDLTNNNVGFLFTPSQSFTEIENTVTSAVFEFTALPKTLFALLGVIFMLSGALMIFRGPVD